MDEVLFISFSFLFTSFFPFTIAHLLFIDHCSATIVCKCVLFIVSLSVGARLDNTSHINNQSINKFGKWKWEVNEIESEQECREIITDANNSGNMKRIFSQVYLKLQTQLHLIHHSIIHLLVDQF